MSGDSHPYAVEALDLGKKYLRGWALRDASFRLPAGCISALVGPNGAGKSTFLGIAARLLRPTTGSLRLFGTEVSDPAALQRVAFVDQERPLYKGFSVAETLRLGRELNPRWDQAAAERIVEAGRVPLGARIGTLSSGQRTRVALALAFGKRAELLLLDEPMADLDPLARHELSALLLSEATERGLTVLMSSHLLSELEEMCDHLVVLADGRLRMAGYADQLIPAHRLVTGLADPGPGSGHDDHGVLPPVFTERHTVIESRITGRQFTALIRPGTDAVDAYESVEPSLEEVLLAYLRSAEAPALITPGADVTAPATAPAAPQKGRAA
ncbi:ABC transporter ATP-binding protein [Streptomyces uncialis]|uniref:ABC transporter ATP-binding protein n=1 Tax=Streptomyces uncialis TaxID=1048205 RepID=A0A1Q4V2I0_9ACTN|nr:ABC transporter ATP-binding protein [Streptomyces uncialis]OKH92026.1 ABC transporter ATP-binding protein [Streptomyces uncialis]WTE11528.1 ABC transporter ATP-binding protein [Streptomyces uncialis]